MAPEHDETPSPLPSAKDLPAARPDEVENGNDATRIAPQRDGKLQAGDVLKGRFELVEKLGAGGMGMVFKALDRLKVEAEDRQPYVAVKVVGHEFQRHRISFKAFQREAKRAQNLAHPNIVRVYDFDRDGPRVFITMEYLSGQSLDKIIKTRPSAEIPLSEALTILRPVGSALSFAHENGIVHCDIKPSNIFVTDEGVVKVIDFGIARAVKRPDTEQTTFDIGSLNARSPMYASPELGEGDEEPSERDDVYSLACVAYELLTGRHPFGRQPLASAPTREPPKPQGLTRKQWAGLRRALAFERDRRTPTVQELLADLSAPADRRPYVLAAAVVAVVALGIVGTLVIGGNDEKEPADLPESPVAVVEEPGDERAEPSVTEDRPLPSGEVVQPLDTPRFQERREEVDGGDPELVSLPRAPSLPEPSPVTPDTSEIESVLSKLRCALLEGEAKDNLVEVRGHAAATPADWVQELRALPGVQDVVTRIAPVSTVHCPTIEVFAPLLRAGRDHELDLRTASLLRDGDHLMIDVVANVSGFLYIDYFSTDGTVVHLLPRPNVRENRIERGSTLRLGRGGGTGTWPVGPPFGTEMITIIMTPEPLFAIERVELESSFSYREDLERALEDVRRRNGIGSIHAAVSFVAIRPRAENVSR